MPRSKKTRKVGKIGVSKADKPQSSKRSSKSTGFTSKSRKSNGNKSGTRQQVAETENARPNKSKVDPKIGSKTPIDINKYRAGNKKPSKLVATADTPRYNTPQDELEAIENNKELEHLLEKQQHKALTKTELIYVDNLTSRYQELCEMLGIDISEEDEIETEDDPFAQLDAIKLEDFKD
ncbi:Der GTPase-activating protein YihI [Glaciecola petra]|uniref:Der GTPase-activating protein YihI n=1 Tax=Glaciecola petra TaxID=3075602 RepID=A0ABU2ZTR6_9ALTE|nr:Der GTPase-activating protein YihI [Aestuariibacter sp. P117]MDT0594802.1 Der GTPase-activating protein YihI [Aestuariibacter sp. P117]